MEAYLQQFYVKFLILSIRLYTAYDLFMKFNIAASTNRKYKPRSTKEGKITVIVAYLMMEYTSLYSIHGNFC